MNPHPDRPTAADANTPQYPLELAATADEFTAEAPPAPDLAPHKPPATDSEFAPEAPSAPDLAPHKP
ncbi:hypothetical protein JHN63_31015, partial [Streptomyces sp. MBT65]|nr:hypothetical protein [Streptomyces sp. MBT65]